MCLALNNHELQAWQHKVHKHGIAETHQACHHQTHIRQGPLTMARAAAASRSSFVGAAGAAAS
jgi:hypothetical protein